VPSADFQGPEAKLGTSSKKGEVMKVRLSIATVAAVVAAL
jgi:hypothetical protein